MSDETYSLICLVGILVAIFGIWNNFRRRQLMRRIIKSLTPEQRRAVGLDPPESDHGEGSGPSAGNTT